MTSSVLSNLHSLPREEGSSIGAAWREVAVAFNHLAAALWRSIWAPVVSAPATLTAFEEAEALRDFAAGLQQQDPNFAQDLFAAADRHEIEAAAAVR